MRKLNKLMAVLFAFAMLAAACGGSDSGDTASVDTSAIDEANAARDAAVADADAAKAAAEQAQADAQAAVDAAQAEADDARAEASAAADAAADSTVEAPVALPFAGEVVKITGPERSPEEWNAIESAMIPFEEATGMQVIYTGSADWEAEINVQIAAGNPPDISIFPQPGKLADFAREGNVLELPATTLAVAQDNWHSSQISFGEVDGAFYGMPRRELAARFDDIVEFAGLEQFIDEPVKHYSSGMYVRLGFAVAVNLDPDVLLVGEVLAVGDEAFQLKCLSRITQFQPHI